MRIQAILQQNDSWSPTRDQFQQSSHPPRNNQIAGMSNMNHGMGTPDMFNPMMAMNGPNMMSYQQQMQMQQFMMQQQQQQQQQQQMSRNQNMQPGMDNLDNFHQNHSHLLQGMFATNATSRDTGSTIAPMYQREYMCEQTTTEPRLPVVFSSKCKQLPSCLHSTEVDANKLIPNKSLRNSIQKYKDEHGDPDDEPLEPPPTQEPVSTISTTIEEPTNPVETSNTENKPSNGNQAPSEVPQSPPKRNAQPARQYPTSGMPIQVFQSEERVQKSKPYNKQDDGDNDFAQQGGMMEQNEFYNGGGGDMGWMGMMGMPPNMMGMPPGMNPAMMAGMMGMGMPPPGGFPGFFPGPGGFPPPFPPPEMFGFPGNMNLGAGRGGFSGRGGRGGGRGGAKPSGPPPSRRVEGASHNSPSTPTRQDVASPAEHKEEAGNTIEDIPTGPRAERDRHEKPSHHDNDRRSSRNRHSSRSRSPRRHESDDRQHYSDRHHSRSSSKHDRDSHHSSSTKRRSRSRRRSRSPSERRSRSVSQRRSRSPSKKRSPTPTGPRHTDDIARPVDSVVESVLDEIIFDEEPAPAPSDRDRKEHDSSSKRRSRERSSSRSHSSRSRHRDSRDKDRDSRHRHRSSDRHSRRQRSRDRR
ncbi:unnamed protein product [Umbelopsis ramanniana]